METLRRILNYQPEDVRELNFWTALCLLFYGVAVAIMLFADEATWSLIVGASLCLAGSYCHTRLFMPWINRRREEHALTYRKILKWLLVCSWRGHRREPWKFDSLNRCMRCGAP